MAEKRIKRNNKKNNSMLFWISGYIMAIVFISIFWNMPMIPQRWSYYAIIVIGVLLFITYTFAKHKGWRRLAAKITNCILAAFLLIASIIMPYYKAKISDVIGSGEDETSYIYMNLYVMTDEYKEAHPDIFSTSSSFEQKDNQLEDLKQYKNQIFITETKIDAENQTRAVSQLKKKLKNFNLDTLEKESYIDQASALYANEGQVMLMNQDYASMISEIEGFENFDQDTRILYTIKLKNTSQKMSGDKTLTEEPFSIFFGGNDQEGDLTLVGRTDVDMVVTVNPKTYQIVISSFPRDSLVPNPGQNDQPDKLTHLGLLGVQNTMKELSSLLQTDINNYVVLNFTTYREIISSLGGVDVENDIEFTADDGEYFPAGKIHIDGDQALMYVRERHAFEDGDFERAYHQQLVMKAIIAKVSSPAIISKFDTLLTNLKGKFLSNISDSAIYSLCEMQLDKNIKWNVVNYRITGSFGNSICASSGSTVLSVVLPFTNQIQFLASTVSDAVSGKTVVQQELPEGEGVLVEPMGGELGTESYNDYSYNNYQDEMQYQQDQTVTDNTQIDNADQQAQTDQNQLQDQTNQQTEVIPDSGTSAEDEMQADVLPTE